MAARVPATDGSTNLEGIKSCCISGHIHSGTPKGRETTLAGLNAYETGDNKEKTILFITDIFGYQLPNARLLADEYAKGGFYVIIPDFFEGDPVPADVLEAVAPLPSQSEAKSVADKAADTAKMGLHVPPWLAKHREAVSLPLIEKAVQSLRDDSSIKKIGAVGFCWGGRYAMMLCQKDRSPNVDCAVANHPSFLDIEKDVPSINKPVLVNVGTLDTILPQPELAKLKEKFLKDLAGVDTHVNNYEGAVHGFTVRPDLSNDKEKKQQDEACEATVEWFKKHLA